MLIEVKEKKKQLLSQCFGKENKNTKKTIKYFFGGGAFISSRIFAFRGGGV
jgi:hypothetical protein